MPATEPSQKLCMEKPAGPLRGSDIIWQKATQEQLDYSFVQNTNSLTESHMGKRSVHRLEILYFGE